MLNYFGIRNGSVFFLNKTNVFIRGITSNFGTLGKNAVQHWSVCMCSGEGRGGMPRAKEQWGSMGCCWQPL